MKYHALFSSKDKSNKKIIVASAATLLGALRVNPIALRKAKIVYSFGLSECNCIQNSQNSMEF